MLQKIRFFWRKRPKTIVIRIIVWMTIFKSIHMAFNVNTSWACALFRNNKQHVVLGQKEKLSTRGRKRTLTDSEIKRNRSEVSSKWNKCRIYVGDQLDRCRWMERTQGSAWLLLIGKPNLVEIRIRNEIRIPKKFWKQVKPNRPKVKSALVKSEA